MKIKKGLFGYSLDISLDELMDFERLPPSLFFPLVKFLDKEFGFDFINTFKQIAKEETK